MGSLKDACFFTAYDDRAKEMAQGMVRSVKRFYPDIPFVEHVVPLRKYIREVWTKFFCDEYLQKGRELFKEYKRIIYIDPDSIMCNLCPDLFGDYELGVVKNNKSIRGEFRKKIYLNAGLTICTNPTLWEARIEEYNRRNNERVDLLNEQNAITYLYHRIPNKCELLEYPDRSYGIYGESGYFDMFIKENELYLPTKDGIKKLCIFHAAGVFWKINGLQIKFNLIKNKKARKKLRSYTR